MPGEPTSLKADGDQWGGVPTELQVPSPSHIKEKASMRSASKGEVPENEPPGQGESSQDRPPLEPDQQEIPDIVILDQDEVTIEEPQGSSTPRSEQVQSQK